MTDSIWVFLLYIREAALIEGTYHRTLNENYNNILLYSFGEIPTGSNRIERISDVRTLSDEESICIGLYI
jgi:hypothetical protein